MKAIDTNVLVRFLVNDDQAQAQLVRRYLQSAEKQRGTLFVPLLVVLETIWVLDFAYGIERDEIIAVMSDLLLLPILEFENRQVVQKVISSAADKRFDLPDLLIAEAAHMAGCQTVLTLDKKAAKSELFELME